MTLKQMGIRILVLGPIVILALYFPATLNYYEWDAWGPMLYSFGVLVPLAGSLILGYGQEQRSRLTSLWYLPAAFLSGFAYSVAHFVFDPVHNGAAEAALLMFFFELTPLSIIGTVIAILGASLGSVGRSWRARSALHPEITRLSLTLVLSIFAYPLGALIYELIPRSPTFFDAQFFLIHLLFPVITGLLLGWNWRLPALLIAPIYLIAEFCATKGFARFFHVGFLDPVLLNGGYSIPIVLIGASAAAFAVLLAAFSQWIRGHAAPRPALS